MSKSVTPAGAALLEGYTRLPKTIQGTLSPSQGGTAPTRTDSATSDVATFRSLAKRLKGGLRSLIVSKITLLSVDGSMPSQMGTPIKGPVNLQGVFVPVKGSEPPRLMGTATSLTDIIGGHPPGTPMLVSFFSNDDQSPSAVPFGTQTTLMPLAPVLSYVEWIWSGLLPRALVVCPNGAFLLEQNHRHSSNNKQPANDELERARKAYHNAVYRLNIVVDARKHKLPTDGGTGLLCRAASNVLVVLDGKEDLPSLKIFSSILKKTYDESRPSLENAGTFVVSASLLDVSDEEHAVAPAHVRKAIAAAFPHASIEDQPLTNWNSAPVTITVRVKVRPSAAPSDGTGQNFPLDESLSLHGGKMTVNLKGTVSLRDLRDPKPGETPHAAQMQVERIVAKETTNILSEGNVDGWKTQAELDAASTKLADKLRMMISTSQAYTSEPKVSTEIVQKKTQIGRLSSMPSGTPAVIPPYAISALQPRLAAVLGILPSLGCSVGFTRWQVAEHNGISIR